MPSPLEAAFETLLHTLNASDEPSAGTILETVYRTKFSGGVTMHFDRGTLKMIELGRPIRIDLTRRSGSGT